MPKTSRGLSLWLLCLVAACGGSSDFGECHLESTEWATLESEMPAAVSSQTKLADFNAFIGEHREALEAIDTVDGSYTWMGGWVSAPSERCADDEPDSNCRGTFSFDEDTYITFFVSANQDPSISNGGSIEIRDNDLVYVEYSGEVPSNGV